jgi:hypothetical protein
LALPGSSILRHLFIILLEHLIQGLWLEGCLDSLSRFLKLAGILVSSLDSLSRFLKLAGILVSRSSGGSSSRISRQQTPNT